MTVIELLTAGLEHHQAGRLNEASERYNTVLSVQPTNADALHLLGVVAHQLGRLDDAIALLLQAIELDPSRAPFLNSLGTTLADIGRLPEALAVLQRAVERDPGLAELHYNSANVLVRLGREAEAISAYTRALAERPNYPEARVNLAVALNNHGTVRWAAQDFSAALACFDRALELRHDYPEAHFNRGTLLGKLERIDEAIAALERALELRPEYVEAHNNLAALAIGRFEYGRAVAHLRETVRLRPDSAEAHLNLAVALADCLEHGSAIPHFDRAESLEPDNGRLRWSRSLTLLQLGQFERGWPEYEWRFHSGEMEAPRHQDLPPWDGSLVPHCRLLIWAEQGLGDTLQFVRYVRDLVVHEISVTLEVQPELVRLLRSSFPEVHVVSRGEPHPACDLQVPLLSLPNLMNTRMNSIPAVVPYLDPDTHEEVAAWADRLGRCDDRRRVGLAWAGNPHYKHTRRRDVPARALAGLAHVPGIQWISLQKNPTERPPLDLLDGTSDLHDMAETAALLMNLDLVISVDTSVAHLAGALGRPVWLLLPYAPDWRWLLDRSDTPWYPTARLFRQPRPGDWTSVLQEVTAALQY